MLKEKEGETCWPSQPKIQNNKFWAHGMSSIKEQGDLLKTLAHQATQSGMLTRMLFSRVEIKCSLMTLGSLVGVTRRAWYLHSVQKKNWWKLEQGDLFMNNHPVLFKEHTDKFIVEDNDMDSEANAEADMSLLSRSFLHRVNDRLWKILNHSSDDAMQDIDKRSMILGNVYVFDIGSICNQRKELLRNFTFHKKYRKRSNNETDVRHIWKVDSRSIRWDFWSDSNWLGKFFMETGIFGQWWRSRQSLARKASRIFRFCVVPWKGASEPPIKYFRWRQVDVVEEFIIILNFVRNWWRANGTRVEYVPRVHLIAAHQQSPRVHDQNDDPPQFKGRIIFISMFNDISWWSEENKQEYESSAQLVSIHAKRFSPGRWSFLGPGSETKWYSTFNERPQGEWDKVAELMMIAFDESKHPVFRAASPLSRGTVKSKGGGKLSFHLFLLISSVSTEESQICVTNANPAMLEQGDLFWWDNLTHCLCSQVWWKHLHLWPMILHKKIHCKSTKNEWTSYHKQNRVIKFCTDAGFLKTVDVGQCFMTEDTEEFLTIYRISDTLYQEMKNHLIRVNTKIGSVLEVTTSYLQDKYGVEIRIESVNKDNSHSWVRISHDLNKLVTDLSNNKDNNEQGNLSDEVGRIRVENECNLQSQADQRLKQNHEDLLLVAHLQELYPSAKESGLMLSQELIRVPLSQCEKKNDCSSSSWSFTSRRRWSDWTLETKRLSSERILELSALIWWNVEE